MEDKKSDKFSESFDELTREELVELLRKVLKENLSLNEQLHNGKCSHDTPVVPETRQMEFGSYGSSNVMFLKAAEHSVGGSDTLENVETSTEAVHRNYMALERGSGAFKAPNVSNYRELFKKSINLEYEADSPALRNKIDNMDHSVEDLRVHLQLMVDRCGQYCHLGKEFVAAGKAFASLLSQLAEPIWRDRLGAGLSEFLAHFGHAFEMIESYREAVIASLETTFLAPMQEFVKLEAKSVNKLKSKVQKTSDEYEAALAKFLSLKLSVDDEVIHRKEAELATLKQQLEMARYDLITELNALETKKKFQLCERTCSALYTYLGFFAQCHTMVATMEPAMRTLTAEMSGARNDFRRQTMLNDAKRIRLRNELHQAQKQKGKIKHSRIVSVAAKSTDKMRRNISLFTRELGKSTASPGTPEKGFAGGIFFDEAGSKDPVDEIVKEGFLRKKTNSMMKDWKRRWFFIQGGKLFYARTDNLTDSPPIHVCDLLISTVRENREEDMRFTFEVISPGQRVYTLQGESEKETNDWVQVIRDQIEKQLALQIAPPSLAKKRKDSSQDIDSTVATNLQSTDIDNLHKINHECADCGAQFPSWASLNLCIMICIECSGIHRSLGTHISKVRSISLDKWSAGNTQLLVLIGNARSNAIWEEKLNMSTSDDEDGSPPESKVKDSHPLKIAPRASRRQREEFIYAKYVRRDFLGGAMTPDESSRLLYESAREGNLVEMMRAIACGADVNWRNSNDNGKTCLHVACAEGNGLAVELICQWNVNVDIADSSGKTAIDYSAEASHTIIESLVRKLEGDLDQHAQSSEGDMLLQLAEEDRVVANDDGVSNSDRLPADFVLDQAPTERPRRSTSGAPEVRRRSSGGEMLAAAAAIVASALAGRREVDKGEVSTDDEKRVDGNEDTDVATIS